MAFRSNHRHQIHTVCYLHRERLQAETLRPCCMVRHKSAPPCKGFRNVLCSCCYCFYGFFAISAGTKCGTISKVRIVSAIFQLFHLLSHKKSATFFGSPITTCNSQQPEDYSSSMFPTSSSDISMIDEICATDIPARLIFLTADAVATAFPSVSPSA